MSEEKLAESTDDRMVFGVTEEMLKGLGTGWSNPVQLRFKVTAEGKGELWMRNIDPFEKEDESDAQ